MNPRRAHIGTTRWAAFAALCAAVVAACLPAAAQIPAFPGAEGFGAAAVGGRGGAVYFVTNLQDYGENEPPIPGSLRAGIEMEGPRTIIFRTAGHIALERTLEIDEPFLTIAGQTAPGDGVALTHYGIDIAAPQVIVRYLRVRPGDVAGEEQDAINIRSSDVILDHCSASWGTDETVSIIGDATNVTVQWSLIAESLNESVHSKGAHGYGSLISTAGDVSLHHNVFAFHNSRNPRPKDALLDFRNNVIYGWGSTAGYNVDDATRMNYVGNYLRPLAYSGHEDYAFRAGSPDTRMYLRGNVLVAPGGDVSRDDWAMIEPPDGVDSVAAALGVDVPFPAPTVTTHSAEEAFALLLDDAGATLPRRDAADRRIIDLMRAGEGGIIDSQDEVGGWPELAGGSPPEDADADGLPDEWERAHGFDPTDSGDQALDADGDGYTNIEEYLNGTDPTEAFGWIAPPVIRPASGTSFTQAPLFVTMASSEPAVPVFYTTDGTEPDRSSPRYERPLRIYDDAHVRAKALADSRPTTASFASYTLLEWVDAAGAAELPSERGLRVAIYEADDWDEGASIAASEPARCATVETVTFDLHAPDGRDALVFDGWIEIPRDGIYAFHLRDDARSELRIGGRTVTGGRPEGAEPGRIALRKGLHAFELRSIHEEPRSASLEWEGPGIDRGTVPGAAFKQPLHDRPHHSH